MVGGVGCDFSQTPVERNKNVYIITGQPN